MKEKRPKRIEKWFLANSNESEVFFRCLRIYCINSMGKVPVFEDRHSATVNNRCINLVHLRMTLISFENICFWICQQSNNHYKDGLLKSNGGRQKEQSWITEKSRCVTPECSTNVFYLLLILYHEEQIKFAFPFVFQMNWALVPSWTGGTSRQVIILLKSSAKIEWKKGLQSERRRIFRNLISKNFKRRFISVILSSHLFIEAIYWIAPTFY